MVTAQVRQQLVSLNVETWEIDVSAFQEGPFRNVVTQLVPRVMTTVDRGYEIFRGLRDRARREDVASFGSPRTLSRFYGAIDELMAAGSSSQQLVWLSGLGVDALHCLRGQLNQARVLGDARGTFRVWHRGRWITPEGSAADPRLRQTLTLCRDTRRKLLKLTSATERAVCAAAGVEPELRFQSEIQTAMRLRCAYLRLRHIVMAENDPSRWDIEDRLLEVSIAISRLLGREIEGELRDPERRELRRVLGLILTWRYGGEPRAAQGKRLWNEAVALVASMEDIGHRRELQEHDRQLVERVYTELYLGEPRPREITGELWEGLEMLAGYDDELKHLIDRDRRLEPDECRPALDRIRSSFEHRSRFVV